MLMDRGTMMTTFHVCVLASIFATTGCGKKEPCKDYAKLVCEECGDENKVACDTAKVFADEAAGNQDFQKQCEENIDSFEAEGGCETLAIPGGGSDGGSDDDETDADPDIDADADSDDTGSGPDTGSD